MPKFRGLAYLLYLLFIWLHELGFWRALLPYHSLEGGMDNFVLSLAHPGYHVILDLSSGIKLQWDYCL